MSPQTALIPTAVPGLDSVLGGGLAPGALVVCVGPPGAGKTILTSQVIFEAARRGLPSLIFTAFAESAPKLLDHIRPFGFFSESLVGGSISLLALQTVLGDSGTGGISSLLQVIRQSQARMVLIDSYQGIARLLPDQGRLHRLLADLANLAAYLDTTILLTMEGLAWDPALGAFLTSADSVIGLDYTVEGWRHMRRLEVLKQRGKAPLHGLHPYTITAPGITVVPRMETRPAAAVRPRPDGRTRFALPELDTLLGGGLPAGSLTVLAGAPGTGKTTMALHWALADLNPAATSLFLSFSESPTHLETKAASLGLTLAEAHAAGIIRLLHVPPVELQPDLVAAALLDAMTPTTQRVVIDDVASLLRTLGSRTLDYLAALAGHLERAGLTSLFLLEIPPFGGLHLDGQLTPLLHVADNLLMVQQVAAMGRLHHFLAVIKMRYSAYDSTLRAVIFNEKGVRVLPAAETPPEVWMALASVRGGLGPSTSLNH